MEIAFAILAMSVRQISSVGWIEHQLLLKYLSYIVHCQGHFFWGISPLHLSFLSKFIIATPFTQESPFLDSILDVLGIQWIRLDLQEIKKMLPKKYFEHDRSTRIGGCGSGAQLVWRPLVVHSTIAGGRVGTAAAAARWLSTRIEANTRPGLHQTEPAPESTSPK